MKLNKKTIALFSFLTLLAYTGCEDNDDDNTVKEIETPTTFTFQSRFDDQSSVSYSGQVVRNLLINDIKTQMGTDAGSKNPATLLSMMANDDASRAILSASGKSPVQTKYHDISTSHLNDRLDAVSGITIPGYNTDAKTLVVGMLNEAAAAGKTRATGIRLDQMVQKTLWGAISYWQATSKYMVKLPDEDNTVAVDGKNYTKMEHYWDEGFWYLYGEGANVARADLGSSPTGNGVLVNKYFKKVNDQAERAGIAQTVYDAFKLGRAAIVAENYTVRDEQAAIIAVNLSKVIGYKAMDYLNGYVSKKDAGNPADAIHALSEGWGFVLSLQFTNDGTGQPYFSNSEVNAMLAKLDNFWTVSSADCTSMANEIKTKMGL